jgi:hypothetical protein
MLKFFEKSQIDIFVRELQDYFFRHCILFLTDIILVYT